jgi:outer membrane protein, heavy metal efflux system
VRLPVFHMLAVTALACAGCNIPPVSLPDDGIVAATGIDGPIRFHLEGGPLDRPETIAGTLTLPDAVRRALDADPRLQAAMARTRATLADSRQARLLPNPMLDITLRFPEGGGKSIVEAGLAAELVSILQRPRRSSAADHRLRAASAEVLTVALDVLAEVQERYAAVQASEARLVVLEQRRTLLNRLVELARARFRAGETGRLDVLVLETQAVRLDGEIIEERAARTDGRLALARLVGQPSGDFDGPLSPWTEATVGAAADAPWIMAALEKRPEIQARQWELAALGDDLRLTALLPWEGGEVGASAERDDAWSAGPSVSAPLPIFDTGSARREKARAEVIEARHRMTQTKRQVVEEVRRALASLSANRAAVERVRSALIPLLEQRREQAEATYRNGLGDITPTVLAEQELQEARAKLIDLQLKSDLALVRLHRAAGGPGVAKQIELRPTRPSTLPTDRINSDGSSR